MKMVNIDKKIFDVDAYYKMAEVGIIRDSDRVELIQGEVINMSPINSHHASVVNKLTELLVYKLYKKAIVSIQIPLRLNQYNEPEPDIVIAKYVEDRYMSHHPAGKDVYLVMEVSDSSLLFDRGIKLTQYAENGIPEYWIINLKDHVIEAYRSPENNEYTVQQKYNEHDIITCHSIFFELNVQDII